MRLLRNAVVDNCESRGWWPLTFEHLSMAICLEVGPLSWVDISHLQMCELDTLLKIFRSYGYAWDAQFGRHFWPQMTSCISFMSHTLRDIKTKSFELVTLTRTTAVARTDFVGRESVKKLSEKEM